MMITYIYFSSIQVIDLFMEMQFEHLPFISDLNRNTFNIKNFFTTYGEHITAGYNIILLPNYYFFRINGSFDNYFSIFLNLINFCVLLLYFKNFLTSLYSNKIFILLLALSCFSLTNNPMMGMALSAQLGISITLIAIYFLKSYFVDNKVSRLCISLFLFLIAIGLCLGGYAAGAISFLFFIFIFETYKGKYKNSLVFFVFFILSLITYLSIFSITNNTVLVNHAKGSFNFNLFDFINFLLIMPGNAFLGKAFFESTNLLWPYYLISAFFIFWFISYLSRFNTYNKFFDILILFIIFYPIATIFFSALFRHHGGGDPLGQWYFRHISFIPLISYIAIIQTDRFFLFNYKFDNFFKNLSVFLVFIFVLIGNLFDIKKSPYVENWKLQFYNQVPDILFNTEHIDKSTHFNFMLNDLDKVKDSLIYFYENNLWVFRNPEPHFFSKKLYSDSYLLQVICPVDSNELHLYNAQNDFDFILQDGFYLFKYDNFLSFTNYEHKKNFYEFVVTKQSFNNFRSNIQCY